jgi:hypothetical protein
VTNVSAEDETVAFSDLLTANGTVASLSGNFVTGGQAPYRGVPPANLVSGDLHALLAYSSGATSLRGIQAYYSAAVTRTLSMPPRMSEPTVSQVATAPYARFRTQIPSQGEYAVLMYNEYAQGGSGPTPASRLVDVVVTSGYFNGTPPTWLADIPDFSSAAGFNPAWGLASGVGTEFFVEVDGGSPLSAPRSDGATATFSFTGGTIFSGTATVPSRMRPARNPAAMPQLLSLPVKRGQGVTARSRMR